MCFAMLQCVVMVHAYLRVVYAGGFVGCYLAMGESRVAPLKPISVPRARPIYRSVDIYRPITRLADI